MTVRFLRSLLVILQNEPVLVRTLVGSVLVLLNEFYVPVSDGQAKAIDAVIVLACALAARAKVTPLEPAPRKP